MSYPLRTIPPSVLPRDVESHPSSPSTNNNRHHVPESYWSSFAANVDLAGRTPLTPEQRAAYLAEQEARDEAERAREKAAPPLPHVSLLVRVLRRIDTILCYSFLWLMGIRLVVFVFSTVALGLAARIAATSPSAAKCDAGRLESSTNMALVVNSISIIYTLGLTWDEFANKAVVERPFQVRLAITGADVMAITFNAANLAVAFSQLTDASGFCRETGHGCPASTTVCHHQSALASILTIIQVCWILALYTSLYRMAARIDVRARHRTFARL